MPNRDGTGPGLKRNSDRGRCTGDTHKNGKQQVQFCRQFSSPGFQIQSKKNQPRFINIIRFVSFGFFTVLLPSAARFGKLLIAERRKSVPRLDYKGTDKPTRIQEQNDN